MGVCAIVGVSRGSAFRAALASHIDGSDGSAECPDACPGGCDFEDADADEDPLPLSHGALALHAGHDVEHLVLLELSPEAPATAPLDKPPAA